MWQKNTVAYFNILFEKLPEETKEGKKNPQLGYSSADTTILNVRHTC